MDFFVIIHEHAAIFYASPFSPYSLFQKIQTYYHQLPTMPSKKMSNNTTMCYNYGGGDKEFVFSCKNRPFAVLCSKHLPTPATTLIDHNLIMELGLKLTDLQCKKISFAGRKLRLLGKISTTDGLKVTVFIHII